MKFKSQVSALSVVELRAREADLLVQIARARMDVMAGKSRNTRQTFNLRKQLAIVKTYASKTK